MRRRSVIRIGPLKVVFERAGGIVGVVSEEIDPVKLLGAAYLYDSVGKDPLLAWEAMEDLANKPEHYRRLREWADRQMEARIALRYPEGIKSITGQDKLSRANEYFQRFLDEENIPGLKYRIANWYYGRYVDFSAGMRIGSGRVSHMMNCSTFGSDSRFSGKIDAGGKSGNSDSKVFGVLRSSSRA